MPIKVYIPRDKLTPELLRLFGFTEGEINDFFEHHVAPVRVDTSIHDMKDIEFDEYEEVK